MGRVDHRNVNVVLCAFAGAAIGAALGHSTLMRIVASITGGAFAVFVCLPAYTSAAKSRLGFVIFGAALGEVLSIGAGSPTVQAGLAGAVAGAALTVMPRCVQFMTVYIGTVMSQVLLAGRVSPLIGKAMLSTEAVTNVTVVVCLFVIGIILERYTRGSCHASHDSH